MGFKIDEYCEFVGVGMTAEEMQRAIEAKRAKNSKPFEPFKFQFVLNKFRRDKEKLPPKPVIRSRYCQQMWDKGAGWNE